MAPDHLEDAQRAAEAAAADAERAAGAAQRAAEALQDQRRDEDVGAEHGRGGDGTGTGQARG